MLKKMTETPAILIASIITAIAAIAAAVIGRQQTIIILADTNATSTAIAGQASQAVESFQNTIQAPTQTLYPTYTPYPTYTALPFPTVSPTPSVSLPFTDNFDLGARLEWRKERGTWIVTNGKYTISDLGDDWTSGISTIGDIAWANYVIGATVDLQPFCGNNRAAILVRVQDTKNFLAFKIHDGGECIATIPVNYAAWYEVKNGEWAEISNTRYENYPHGESFTLTIQVNGDFITTYLNNEQILSFSNTSFSTGKVGVLVESRKGNGGQVQTATFDDFSVASVPAP